jgi:hypothetical protein
MSSTSANNKASKKNLTSYWGIEFSNESSVLLTETGSPVMNGLVPLKKCHSTLLYVGKKVNPNEAAFADFEGADCVVTVDAFGLSTDAMAFRVTTILTDNGRTVPSFAEKQHITFALREGVPAKDSVKTLLGDGTVTPLDKLLILTGKVKRFLY